jgi:hypothetical protein
MKSSKRGTGSVKGSLRLVRELDTGETSIQMNSANSASLMTTPTVTTQSENSQTMEKPVAKWSSQLPSNPLPMDNWLMYQIQSMRTVSGLRGELPTEMEIKESSTIMDVTSRTLLGSPVSDLAPPRGWFRRVCGMIWSALQ